MGVTLEHPFDDLTVFREYEPHELKALRYPYAWEKLEEPAASAVLNAADMIHAGGVKDVVRAVAGHRCQRCGHPFRVGESSISERDADELAHDAALQRTLTLFPSAGTDDAPILSRHAPPTNWSPCDERCTHGGPYRAEWATGSKGEVAHGGLPAGKVVAGSPPARVMAAWRILTVHHLNERKFDLRWWNLAALCQRCHLQIQRKVTMEVPYPWEHTEWFRPHAAAWYALKFLGEHLTYTATIARLDELLELGREREATERMPL